MNSITQATMEEKTPFMMPALIIDGAALALNFYKSAFGAVELSCVNRTDDKNKIARAKLKIGDTIFMIADEFPDVGAVSPKTLGGTSTGIVLYVDDADAVFNKAIHAGAKAISSIQDYPYGERYGMVLDPFGHRWRITSFIH